MGALPGESRVGVLPGATRYGTLKTWASELGYNDAVKLLDQTLTEEKNTDNALSQLAEAEVNRHAEAPQSD